MAGHDIENEAGFCTDPGSFLLIQITDCHEVENKFGLCTSKLVFYAQSTITVITGRDCA